MGRDGRENAGGLTRVEAVEKVIPFSVFWGN